MTLKEAIESKLEFRRGLWNWLFSDGKFIRNYATGARWSPCVHDILANDYIVKREPVVFEFKIPPKYMPTEIAGFVEFFNANTGRNIRMSIEVIE